MKAVGYQASLPINEDQALLDIELPVPVASGQDILVRVEAVSVNPVDTKIRMRAAAEAGQYNVLGFDAAGVVEAVGPDVRLFKPGDKVWYAGAMNRPGSNAQFQLVDERLVAEKPLSLSFEQAAALPLTAITAWELLFDRFGLSKDSTGTLLILGASGGVGSIMIQLAKALTELTVIASASRQETQEWVKELGADFVVNHSQNLQSQLEALEIGPINYIASLNGTGQHLATIAEVIAPQGKFGLIDDADVLDVMPFKRKSVSIHWEFMFTRSLFQTSDMIQQHKILRRVSSLVDSKNIKSTANESLGLINAANLKAAHALLESNKAKGKIVLAGFEE
ncbi:zinc-binding alcohol dehydrogenase family protein [Reinekea marina]|uniref:Zinc-type alcohol dehydrogenase-like protein n=1 Tax=Reinekea marina TaxID=1310421 RepID=A0ABV7WP87_9GAMM|nr:zinc-binding alcohol dehydrogenase family protein [Reinekea marina]MDN3648582.1 zinc-binding alcohol dehydrogenase family protein [Reinekea marina]